MSRSFGATSFTTRGPILMMPSEISSKPAIMRNSVDFPQPEGPTNTQNSPSAMSTSTPCSILVAPKLLCAFSIVTDANFASSGARSSLEGTPSTEPGCRTSMTRLLKLSLHRASAWAVKRGAFFLWSSAAHVFGDGWRVRYFNWMAVNDHGIIAQ